MAVLIGDGMSEQPDAMEPAPRLCPKCRGTMYCGFVPEHKGQNEATLLRWHFGNPDPALDSGLHRHQADQEIELYGGGLVIRGFCCEACGYLELFAR
jgi:hypothetical protein